MKKTENPKNADAKLVALRSVQTPGLTQQNEAKIVKNFKMLAADFRRRASAPRQRSAAPASEASDRTERRRATQLRRRTATDRRIKINQNQSID